MGRAPALGAQILGVRRQARAEEQAPDAVDEGAGGEGVRLRDRPAREVEARRPALRGECSLGQEGRYGGVHDRPRVVHPVAPRTHAHLARRHGDRGHHARQGGVERVVVRAGALQGLTLLCAQGRLREEACVELGGLRGVALPLPRQQGRACGRRQAAEHQVRHPRLHARLGPVDAPSKLGERHSVHGAAFEEPQARRVHLESDPLARGRQRALRAPGRRVLANGSERNARRTPDSPVLPGAVAVELEHQLLGRVLGIDPNPREEQVPLPQREGPIGTEEEVLDGLGSLLHAGADLAPSHGVVPAPVALVTPPVALGGSDPLDLAALAGAGAIEEVTLPEGTRLPQIVVPCRRLLLGAHERAGQRIESRLVRGVGHAHLRRDLAALEVAVHAHLVDVREEGGEGVEVAGRVRIELVVVTLGTAHRRAQPDARVVADAVGRVLEQELLGLGAALEGDHVQAVVGRRHALPHRRVRQEVPRQLLDRKAVEGHVLVERAQHPVPVRPHRPLLIPVVAHRVGVAHEIEPVLGHPLAVVG